MTDEEVRRGLAARRELDETEAAFEAVREGLIAQMGQVTDEKGAYRVAVGLQELDAVKTRLMETAANADLAAHEQEVREHLD